MSSALFLHSSPPLLSLAQYRFPCLFIYLTSSGAVLTTSQQHAKLSANINSHSYSDYNQLQVDSHRCIPYPPTPTPPGVLSLEIWGEVQTKFPTAPFTPVILQYHDLNPHDDDAWALEIPPTRDRMQDATWPALDHPAQ